MPEDVGYKYYQYQGKTYRLGADLTPEQALERIKSSLGTPPAEPTPPVAPTPEAPSEPEGSSVGRFLGGVAHTTLPSVESTKAMLRAAVDPVYSATEFWPSVLKGTAQNVIEDVPEEMETKRPAGVKAFRTALAAIPVMGHPILEALNKLEGGDVAGGAGEMTGLALPFVRPFKGISRAAGVATEGSAAENVARAIKASPATVDTSVANAPQIIEKLGMGTTKKLAERATALRDETEAALAAAKRNAPGHTISLEPTIAKLKEDLNLVNLPEKGIPTPGTAEFSDWLKSQKVSAGGRIQTASQEADLLPGGTLDVKKLAATRRAIQGLNKFKEAFPEGVPAEEALKLRTQAGEVAARGGAYGAAAKAPGAVITPEAKVSSTVQAEISKALKEAVPELDKADLDFNLWKQVGDTLEKSVKKNVLKPVPALEVVAGREALKTVLALAGAGAGGALSGGPGAIAGLVGGYGAFRVAQSVFNSSLWNSMSAANKYALARYLGSGALASGTVASTTVSRGLEKAGEE